MTRRPTTRIRRSARGQQGFTLVEALIAMTILSVGLLAIMQLFWMSAASTTIANNATVATALASETLDVLKAQRFTDLFCGGTGGSLESNEDGFSSEQFVDGATHFRTRWTVQNHLFQGPNGVFITVRSEPIYGRLGGLSRAQFSTFRTCTVTEQCDCA